MIRTTVVSIFVAFAVVILVALVSGSSSSQSPSGNTPLSPQQVAMHLNFLEQRCDAKTNNTTSVCPDDSTCCPTKDHAFGCCPSSNGACCGDGIHCCASGYQCSGNICIAEDPAKHPDMKWMTQFNLCSGPLPLERLEDVVNGTDFLYYSNMGNIHQGDALLEMIMVVIHGAARNADDYFCAGKQAAEMQSTFPVENVGVIAPWFTEPQDNPPEGVVYWNGKDPNGVWRSGQESEPSATESGETISSYAILDDILNIFKDTSKYPKLKLVTVVGHSSGGQTVQRYTLSQHFQTSGTSVHFRYVVANPSSYCYLDARRWVNGTLMIPSEAQEEACPEYNMYEWGLDGNFPQYFLSGPALKDMVSSYKTKDVVYLLGGNDTCNPALIPGCVSHGLEVTCSDMMEGEYRLQRGQNYYKFIQDFYAGEATHEFLVVPNVGHYHSLMFQSTNGLKAIFSNPSSIHSKRGHKQPHN